ncbi:MAG: response regulator transcription factor [Chloroflexota bacterium]
MANHVPQSTVLVVDDDDGIRGALQAMLEDEGYRVRAAGNGLEALTMCGEGLPALILLDLMMPKMDGVTFMEVLRRGYDQIPPVLVLSASQRAPQQVKQMGAEGFLAKPFDLDELLMAVERLVRG